MSQDSKGPRRGGSITLPKGSDQDAIDNALRGPAKKPTPAKSEDGKK